MPLFDAYAGPVREQTKEDSRLNPILKDIVDLPEHVLLLCAGIDILLHEELTFIERICKDRDEAGNQSQRRFESIVFEKGFHGWLERKSASFAK